MKNIHEKIHIPAQKFTDFLVFIRLLFVLFGVLILFSVSAPLVRAAQIFFETKTTQAQIGEKFEVKLLVNTAQESINALEGKVTFSKDIVDLQEIRDGNSIINFWVERPLVNKNNERIISDTSCLYSCGLVPFSGITPGGFTGEKGLIFSMIFQVKNEGEGFVEIRNPKVLLHDGEGTPTSVRISDFRFVAIREPIRGDSWASPKDTERPESFAPEIAKDELIFDGKWFVVFATQDKTSGIDHYKIHETTRIWTRILTKKWVTAESPYLLKDQELRSFVFVKAVDKSGNERIVKIFPRNPLAWYKNYENWIMIIISALIIIGIGFRLKRRYVIH